MPDKQHCACREHAEEASTEARSLDAAERARKRGVALLAARALTSSHDDWLLQRVLPCWRIGAERYKVRPLLEVSAFSEKQSSSLTSQHITVCKTDALYAA